MSEGDASKIDVQASNDAAPQPPPPAPPAPAAPPPAPAPVSAAAEGAGPQEAFAAAGGDGAAIDPGKERELWSGRTSWKHFYDNGVLWGAAVVVLLILPLFVEALYARWFYYGAGALIFLSGAYLFLRYAIQIYGVRYRLTTQRIFVEKGILSRTTDQTELVRVDDVRVKQGIFDRIFGCGDVEVISTDASDASLVMVGVETPDQIAEHVRQHMRILRKKSLFVENL